MKPEFEFSFSIDIFVDKPIIVSNSPLTGKRQLIPILHGKVCGALTGEVLQGGVDSQIIQPNGVCRLSARYALRVLEGTIYIENNGIRRLPEAFKQKLFTDDMSFFDQLPQEDIYFKTVPVFEVDTPELEWLQTSIFICSAKRTSNGVKLDFYRVI
ncbi:DUF3237 family protein [Enterobacter cloacae complex sp. I2]|uniref:DUF3237 family protein n=1 Tax=Enterobacter cloacae complex sp. I2 TaxID=2779603 RepID=UPI001869471F|nr:DUF3237 family protein [Enterobacter cloacae complex sp. I2]EKS7429274.1 DUF3237 family protein [Enterobacter cancerogenus]MBE3513118.1 DUF3237 family protein [Enterobacter cloacae complex sp. I2]